MNRTLVTLAICPLIVSGCASSESQQASRASTGSQESSTTIHAAFNQRRAAVLRAPTRRNFRAEFSDAHPLKMPARAGVPEAYEWHGYQVLVNYDYAQPPYDSARTASPLSRGSIPRDDADKVLSLSIQPFSR